MSLDPEMAKGAIEAPTYCLTKGWCVFWWVVASELDFRCER